MLLWSPSFGAIVREDGVYFCVWAPEAKAVEVFVESQDSIHSLLRQSNGTWSIYIPGVADGDLYRYRLNRSELFPDPASRYQPHGVHGPSQVIDPSRYQWSDETWTGIDRKDLILYELHPGTFAEGTFTGIKNKLQYLSDLGITAIELMPLADFPGRWNWGYDGVDLFAPARCYGTPDDLRDLVNSAHKHGLAVIVDVVYNHFGPDGAYWAQFSREFFSSRHRTPWGDAINFDGPGSSMVRDFLIENALYWIHEFHMDGLRLDAIHSIQDDSKEHFCAELARRVRESKPSRKIHVIAEDHRNQASIIRPAGQNGWNLDAVWSDDFHHFLRRMLCGDTDGYFIDYSDSTENLSTAIQKGWFFTGQYSKYFHENRGTEPEGFTQDQVVIFLQNHDQVGNRPQGQRLNHQIDIESYKAVSALLILAPQLPMLFMGQEWAASTPFCYFTDHDEELGKLVTQGRRKEFSKFKGFSDAESRLSIPDPQDSSTFERSRLDWNELDQTLHQDMLAHYRDLLRLRKKIVTTNHEAHELHDHTISIRYEKHLVIVCFQHAPVEVNLQTKDWIPLWKTGDITRDNRMIRFKDSGAIILQFL
jgi:maltooligosyltrehalose trehalohydrolase